MRENKNKIKNYSLIKICKFLFHLENWNLERYNKKIVTQRYVRKIEKSYNVKKFNLNNNKNGQIKVMRKISIMNRI
jgi:uncharacterized ubiquitin-like protein YukD